MKEEEINRDGRDGRDREELINGKSFFEVLCRRLLFIKLQPIIPFLGLKDFARLRLFS
ncbi:MAG TPA: hypothetical protein VJK54_10785 [Chthoniobacterales bacterium]|nr:hypothetical protein [Chthoniobacterales bacterium]